MVSSYSWGAVPYQTRKDIMTHLIKRDGYMCKSCGRRRHLTVDHILRIKSGGPVMDVDNLQLLCVQCHKEKTYNEQYHHKKRARYGHIIV
jgi:5-methylcytosine-specific restriction protein A